MHVRRADPAHAEVIGRLIRSLAAYEGHAAEVRFSDSQLRRALSGGVPRLHALLAECRGEIIGMLTYTVDFAIWVGGDVVRVDDVFVSESARRKGVGTALFDGLARICAAAGMTARWEIESANASAQAFYRSLGVDIGPKIIARWSEHAIRERAASQPLVGLKPCSDPVLTLLSVADEPGRSHAAAALYQHNVDRTGIDDRAPVGAKLVEPGTGRMVGGLWGRTELGLLFLEMMFIEANYRGKSCGGRLLMAVENEARARGCLRSVVETSSFQAPIFYQRFGYQEFGRVPFGAPGHARIFMSKDLT